MQVVASRHNDLHSRYKYVSLNLITSSKVTDYVVARTLRFARIDVRACDCRVGGAKLIVL